MSFSRYLLSRHTCVTARHFLELDNRLLNSVSIEYHYGDFFINLSVLQILGMIATFTIILVQFQQKEGILVVDGVAYD